MHDVEQGLPARFDPAADGSRRRIRARWKIVFTITVVALALLAIPLASDKPPKPVSIDYTQLVQAIDAGRIASLTFDPGRSVSGKFHSSRNPGDDFVSVFPVNQVEGLLERAERAKIDISFEARDRGPLGTATGIVLQLLIVGALVFFLYIGMRGQGMVGGNVGERAVETRTGFQDIAGTQGAADELREVVEFLKLPARFAAVGARVPKGVLLVGPPGTGKTLLARAVAGEAGVPFFYISGSEVTGFIVGMGAQRIRNLFKKARKKGGVIFIDELDALGGIRGRNRSHNEDDRTLNQLLVEMDGFSQSEGVVVIAATNRPEDLDSALKRPGRFDRTVTVGLPTVDGREAILRLHAARRNMPLNADVDLRRLARLSPGSSGAELVNLLNEAAIAAVREQSNQVAWRHFEIARDRLLLGKERVGFKARDSEWHTVAYHEAGHAIAGVIACPEDGLHKVTIQPRGQAMGVAYFAPEDDRHLHSKRYLSGQIIKGFGGRVAEEIVFGEDRVTGGAESDLVQVNRIARRMVYRLGMGSETGFLVYDEHAGGLSGDAQSRMDAQVRALLDRLYERTREILTEHRPALDALAQALLERETIDGDEALAILEQHGVQLVQTA